MNAATMQATDVESRAVPQGDLLADRPSHPLAETVTPAQPVRIANAEPIDLTQITPMTLLQIAVERGNTPLDVLERLMEKAAETAFTDAMAKFKLEPPVILKTKHVYFPGKDGGATTDYHHASHADVTLPIIKGLAKVGISHMWIPEQRDGNVFITCVLTHFAGHSKRITMFAAPDATGNKKGIQQTISSKTYLERHTLTSITGLTTDDMPDTDGRDPEPQGGDNGLDPTTGAPWENSRATSAPPPAPPAQPSYDQKKFDANLPQWKEAILAGRKNPAGLIAFLEKNGALPLTDAQKKTLHDIRKA